MTCMEPTKPGYLDIPVCQPVDHQGNACGILLMHGFTGSPAHMRKLADGLVEKGYTVKSITLPGHGTTEEDMAKTNWQDWLQSAKEATLDLKSRCDKVTVCGLSMGGVLALLVAEQMKVDGCITISAPMATQNRLLFLCGLIAPIIPRISWMEHPSRSKLDKAYDYGYSGFPTATGQDLHHLIKLARRNLFNVSCPVLCVQSDGDETIWHGSADCILNGIASEQKWKLQLHGMPHVCTISPEAPAILEAMDKALKVICSQNDD